MSRRTPLTKDAEFADLYAAGKTLKEIATTTGISESVQHKIRERLGLPLRNRKAKKDAVEAVGRKVCGGKNGCGKMRLLSNFHYRKDRGVYDSHCKKCKRSKQKARQATEKFKTWNKNRSMQKTYGISHQQYLGIESAQNGLCKICSRPNRSKRTDRLYIDHCHATGKIRGLLCGKCNSAIGLFEDNIEFLSSAIKYLTDAGRLVLLSA